MINEQDGDREPIVRQQQQEPEQIDRYAEDIRLLSAACLGFALTFLSIFHSYMNHQFPGEQPSKEKTDYSSSSTVTKPALLSLRRAYVALGTAGFMWLFGIALISFELSLLFRRGRPTNPHQRRTILHLFYFLAFLGVACSLVSHAVGIYLVHSNIFFSYVGPAAGIFGLVLIIVLGILTYFKE